MGEFATSYTCSLVIASISPGAGNGNVSFKSVMTDVRDDYIDGLMSEGIELATGQSNFLIDQMTGLLAGKLGGSAFGDMPGYVPSQSVDVRQSVDVPNGSRAVVNAVDDINVNRVIPDVEVSGVDLSDGIKEIPDGVQASGAGNIAGAVEALNTGKVTEVDLPNGKEGGESGLNSFGEYSTKIDSKVTVVEKQELPDWLIDTYKNGNYRTVVTNEEITVYRSFGYNAEAGGAFATSSPALSRIQTKVDSAILPEWKNTLRYEAEIVIPKGTTLNIGRVGEQYTMSGARLAGDADQFLLPQNWDLSWIKNIREVKP